MRTFFISDTHFNHANVIEYSRRPFASVDEMNERLIENWNATVGPDDQIYHLGDFAMSDRTQIPAFLARLQGNIVLVPGNHDNKRDDKYFPCVLRAGSVTLDVDGLRVELVHNPAHVQGRGDIALCGHVHALWSAQNAGARVPAYVTKDHQDLAFSAPTPIINVGVDVRQFRPQLLKDLLTDPTLHMARDPFRVAGDLVRA